MNSTTKLSVVVGLASVALLTSLAVISHAKPASAGLDNGNIVINLMDRNLNNLGAYNGVAVPHVGEYITEREPVPAFNTKMRRVLNVVHVAFKDRNQHVMVQVGDPQPILWTKN